ncbi:MAG: TonB-dependent receptor [Phocaeicola sp.]
MKRTLLMACAFVVTATAWSENNTTLPKDTTQVLDLEEITVIASPREIGKLRQSPNAVSLISQKQMQANQINSLKNISALVPNFYMPDYGSRLTSAIYIRGIGSRMNTPAVGMYVDNVPYVDKSAFDFNFYDIERIDILRGPQGTLYGRNTMGGLIKVHTRSPFSYQGTDVRLSYATGNNQRSASLTHYHRINDHFAFSAGGYYEGASGFFTNQYLGKKIDKMESAGGRIRAIWLPTSDLKVDFTAGYDFSDEGGYPYFYRGAVKGYEEKNEAYKPYEGTIQYNRESSYRRGLFNSGMLIEYQADNYIVSSVTGYQKLNDRMCLDQDFLPVDIYTLEQKQRLSTLSQEVTFKSKENRRWSWVAGVSGFYQWLETTGPVTFMEDGVKSLIEENINNIFARIKEENPKAPDMSLKVQNKQLLVPGHFDTPVASGAIFHQSTFHDLFTKGLSLTVGARLEYERLSMSYRSNSDIKFDFLIKMGPTIQIPFKDLVASPLLEGKIKNDYWQLLPKVALKYDLTATSNLYASVAKGYRSGGYNVQMFSDLIQLDMQQKMVDAILDASGEWRKILEPIIAKNMPGYGEAIDISSVTYKPEYSWNYEIGAHFDLFKRKLKADVALFYMNTRNQQIAKFAESGLGRMMVNAGKSESLGFEASMQAAITKQLNLSANYGYTHATFKAYDGGKKGNSEPIDYTGNYVPFVPKHTFSLGGDYTFFFPKGKFQSLTLGMNYAGAGRIYWTEKNDVYQNFAGALHARASIKNKQFQIDLWGKNLLDTNYTTFYFESMNRGFEQRCKPFQLGVDVRYHF